MIIFKFENAFLSEQTTPNCKIVKMIDLIIEVYIRSIVEINICISSFIALGLRSEWDWCFNAFMLYSE